MIDLHTHSTFSDGSCTPEELLLLAEQGGLRALALTDHDTTAGLERFVQAGENSPVEAISGIELSAEFGRQVLHILGYFFDPENPVLNQRLKQIQDGRVARNEVMLKKLQALGYELTEEDILKEADEGFPGRPHFASALIRKGYFKDARKIYRQLLGKNKAAYVNRVRLSPEECVELIRSAGGVAVIAHPGQIGITNTRLRKLIRELPGLGGLEVLHSSHKQHQVQAFERICFEFGLAASGGSDFHGRFTPDLSLGAGFGDLVVPDALLKELRERVA